MKNREIVLHYECRSEYMVRHIIHMFLLILWPEFLRMLKFIHQCSVLLPLTHKTIHFNYPPISVRREKKCICYVLVFSIVSLFCICIYNGNQSNLLNSIWTDDVHGCRRQIQVEENCQHNKRVNCISFRQICVRL